MILGEHSRDNDLEVNPLKGKKLTNVRASGTDEAVRLTTPVRLTLEQAIAYIERRRARRGDADGASACANGSSIPTSAGGIPGWRLPEARSRRLLTERDFAFCEFGLHFTAELCFLRKRRHHSRLDCGSENRYRSGSITFD